jgi:hypothetical protein
MMHEKVTIVTEPRQVSYVIILSIFIDVMNYEHAYIFDFAELTKLPFLASKHYSPIHARSVNP